MSVAGTRIDDELFSTSLLGNAKSDHRTTQPFQPTHLSWPFPDHEMKPTWRSRLAGRLGQYTDQPGPAGRLCQQPQKQSEAYAALVETSRASQK